MTTHVRLKSVLVGCLAIVAATGVRADTLCVNGPVIVLPGISGPPRWKTGLPTTCSGTTTCSAVDDPRWAAGPISPIDVASGTHQTTFRVIRDPVTRTMYVAVRCAIDSNVCTTGNDVFVAYRKGQAPPTVLRLKVNFDSGLTPAGVDALNQMAEMRDLPIGPGALCECILDGAGRCMTPVGPSGLPELACQGIPTVTWMAGQPPALWKTKDGWAMHLAIADASDITKFAVGVKVPLSASVAATWPACPGDCYENVIPADTNAWGDVSASCATNIVQLEPFQVGVYRQDPPAPDNACTALGFGGQIRRNDPNQFVACPSPVQNTGWVRATFRIADWGSVAGPGSWRATGPAASNDLPLNKLIRTSWDPNFVPTVDHQCVLVELSPGPLLGANPIHFVPPAVYRNMDFTSLSEHRETARIEVRAEDMKRLSESQKAQLYLYLQKKNLPSPGMMPMRLPLTLMDNLRRAAEDGTMPKISEDVLKGASNSDIQNHRSVFRLATAQATLEATYPTFKVHPFLEIPDKNTPANGTARRLVVPLPPFGHYLRHEGEFLGFKATLTTSQGTRSEAGALLPTEPRTVAGTTVFEVPISIETVGDKPGADPPATDGGVVPDAAPATDGPTMDGAITDGSMSPAPPPCGSTCLAAVGAPGLGQVPAIVLGAIALLGLGLARRRRR